MVSSSGESPNLWRRTRLAPLLDEQHKFSHSSAARIDFGRQLLKLGSQLRGVVGFSPPGEGEGEWQDDHP
jgi:hypothetical protein